MNVCIAGSYHANNKGDELIFVALQKRLEQKENVNITLLSNDPHYFTKKYGVKAIKPSSLVGVIKTLRHCDMLIIGGGGLFFDYTLYDTLKIKGKTQLLYWLIITKIASKIFKKTVVWYSVGFGPLTTRFARWAVRHTARSVTKILPRDQYSTNLLSDLGITKNVSQSADCVYGLDLTQFSNTPSQNSIVIFPRQWEEQEAQLVTLFKDIITKEIESGNQVILSNTNDEKDGHFTKKIYAHFESNHNVKYSPLKKSDSMERFCGLISNAKYIITMRMHPIIVASLYGIPSIAIEYQTPKMIQCMKDLGMEKYLVSFPSSTPEVFKKLDNCQKMYSQIHKNITKNIENIKKHEKINEYILQ